MIKLSHINKTYGKNNLKTVALKDISLEITRGDMIAVMGTSGSGKSTLLNILGALDVPTSGEYYFEDSLVPFPHKKFMHAFRKQHFSFVFQNFELMNRYTVYENVDMPLIARNVKKRKQRVMDVLEQTGIAELSKKRVSKLSGGQQQRCAISRALVADTDIILADEPTGSLDAKTSIEIMQLLKKINADGKTIIIVTHDKKVADYCKHIVQIEDGMIVNAQAYETFSAN